MIDDAHALTLTELARIQRERDDLRAASSHLLLCLAEDRRLWLELSLTVHDAVDRVAECGIRHPDDPEEQDPIADAAEDEAFRAAVARMDAAEDREDAADVLAKGKPE